MSVSESLDRLEELNLKTTEVASSREVSASGQIISLRYEFATECGNLLKAMCDDPQIFGDRDLFNTLQSDLEVMRSRLAGHQLRWQGDQIDQNFPAYAKASEDVSAAIHDFLTKSRAKLPD